MTCGCSGNSRLGEKKRGGKKKKKKRKKRSPVLCGREKKATVAIPLFLARINHGREKRRKGKKRRKRGSFFSGAREEGGKGGKNGLRP